MTWINDLGYYHFRIFGEHGHRMAAGAATSSQRTLSNCICLIYQSSTYYPKPVSVPPKKRDSHMAYHSLYAFMLHSCTFCSYTQSVPMHTFIILYKPIYFYVWMHVHKRYMDTLPLYNAHLILYIYIYPSAM